MGFKTEQEEFWAGNFGDIHGQMKVKSFWPAI